MLRVMLRVILLMVGALACGWPAGVCFAGGYQVENPKADSKPDEPTSMIANLQQQLIQANAAAERRDFERASRLLQKVVQARPKNITLRLQLADYLFFAGRFDRSIAAYDQAIEDAPQLAPRLWQRGLALYYAKRFKEGVEQFETHQKVNSQDVENAVWHLLCAAQVADLKTARQEMIAIERDTRVPMREVFEMFAGRLTPDQVLAVAEASKSVKKDSPQHRLQQYYAHLYIGLYQELSGKQAASQESMKRAIELNPLPTGNFMGELARVHFNARKLKPAGPKSATIKGASLGR